MKVTDLEYSLEKPKVMVLDWLATRVSSSNFQNVILTEGQEGYGKSTLTAGDAYYLAYRLRRPLRLFFDLEALKEYALKTEDQILIWDDAAFAGLSMEGYTSAIIEFIKILLLARKKRHTYFINIQELWILKKPLVSRAIGMNHVYSVDGLELGRYTYHNEIQTKYLYSQFETKKKRSYKYYSFAGWFPNVLYKIFDEKQYEELKDRAIQTIGTKKEVKSDAKEKRLNELRHKLALLIEKLDIKQEEASKMINIPRTTISRWKNKDFKDLGGDLSSSDHNHRPNHKNNVLYVKPKNENYLALPKEKIIALKPKSKLPLSNNMEF